MKIYKYEIPIKDSFDIQLPVDSKILSIQVQNSKPYIWVLLDENKTLIDRHFILVGTGEEINYPINDLIYPGYIGTIQLDIFVWHLFEDLT